MSFRISQRRQVSSPQLWVVTKALTALHGDHALAKINVLLTYALYSPNFIVSNSGTQDATVPEGVCGPFGDVDGVYAHAL